jgi:hypothetical protein
MVFELAYYAANIGAIFAIGRKVTEEFFDSAQPRIISPNETADFWHALEAVWKLLSQARRFNIMRVIAM